MASISITVPDPIMADLLAAIRARYGEAVAGLSDAQTGPFAVKAHLEDLYRVHKKRTATAPAVATAEAALAEKEAAAGAAVQARVDAEAAALAAAEVDFQGVV